MELKRTPEYYEKRFWKYTPAILLLSGTGAAALSLLIPRISQITGFIIGTIIFYQIMLLASRRKQLAALIVLTALAGLLPSIFLRALCLVFDNPICTVGSLRTETLSFFAIPAIIIVLGWVSTFWIKRPLKT